MNKIANYQVSLKCFLKNEKGEILILKTPDDSSFHGMYDFPGGRIDENEFNVDYIDILKREIFEETGFKKVDIKNKVVGIGRHKVLASERKTGEGDNYIFYLFFDGYLLSNKGIVTLEVHKDYKWVKLEEIVLEDYFCSGYLDAAKMYLNK